MLVKDVMTDPVKTVKADTSLQEVTSLMCLKRYSGLPVVDDNQKLVGFIAERDVLRYLFPSIKDIMANMEAIDFEAMENDYKKVLPLQASDLMIKGVITLSPDVPILKAVSIMARNNFRRIPVAEGEKLVGMLSLGDIHRAIFMKNFTG
ncbi:CBS domain-containing protein [Candidatus Marithrix sp. Canyon 246]|uniref:CBS domain-containing protein n=1 Tax=Candidatus Marithrix sp. Canyon 246 TaxID=1827136 RepID=UPI00084A25A6|nr:CBS domain-containing protein [Candidatus Marithrix sp. Canyon 246]